MSATVASLVRRHAYRVRSDVRRLSRTGSIGWDEEQLVAVTPRGVPTAVPTGVPSLRPTELPETGPYELIEGTMLAAPRWRALSPLTRACVAREALHRLVAIRESTAPDIGPWCGLDASAAARFEGVEARRRGAVAATLALRAQHLRTRRRRPGARPLAVDGTAVSQTTEVVPRGASIVRLGEESPCWSPYPAVFANLVTGNTLILCPTPLAAKSAAVLAEVWRTVLAGHGLPPGVVQLALVPPDDLDYERELVFHHLIALIDDTVPGAGSGAALRTNAPRAMVWQEATGSHVVLLDRGQDHRNVLAGLASAARAGAALQARPLLVVVPPEGLVLGSTRLDGERVAADIRSVAAAAGVDSDPERAWQVTVGSTWDRPLDLLDRLRSVPGVRAVHLVSADARLARRVGDWARDAGVFLLVEDTSGGPISDVREQEASALLDDDFVAPRLRIHHARVRG